MATMKASVMEKRRLAAARLRKRRTRRIRAFRTPISGHTDTSLVNPSDANSVSAPQPIRSDRDDAELYEMEEDEQDKITRMHIQKALASTLEWFQTFQKEIERMRHAVQAMRNDPSWKPESGA